MVPGERCQAVMKLWGRFSPLARRWWSVV